MIDISSGLGKLVGLGFRNMRRAGVTALWVWILFRVCFSARDVVKSDLGETKCKTRHAATIGNVEAGEWARGTELRRWKRDLV
jgi:hypothetical protein